MLKGGVTTHSLYNRERCSLLQRGAVTGVARATPVFLGVKGFSLRGWLRAGQMGNPDNERVGASVVCQAQSAAELGMLL